MQNIWKVKLSAFFWRYIRLEGRKNKFSWRSRGIVKDMAGDKFTSTTSTSREMTSVWITCLRECRNLVLVVFSRRCKISERNTCKGKSRTEIGRCEGRVPYIRTLLRAAYVSICSVANKIAFYEASKCHNLPASLGRATIPSLIDLLLTYSRIAILFPVSLWKRHLYFPICKILCALEKKSNIVGVI